MNAQPITITATLAAWVSPGYQQRDLLACLEKGDSVRAMNALSFYGTPERNEFADCVRIGEADVTVRLIPRDEQTRLVVQALEKQLNEERVKWHERQQAILDEISKLQCLEYSPADSNVTPIKGAA